MGGERGGKVYPRAKSLSRRLRFRRQFTPGLSRRFRDTDAILFNIDRVVVGAAGVRRLPYSVIIRYTRAVRLARSQKRR